MPYDLQPPAQLLYPGRLHDRESAATRQVAIDDGDLDDAPTVTVTRFGQCRTGCGGTGSHEPGRLIYLTVPCDALPHCRDCECGTEHKFYLTDETAAQIRDLLG